MKRTFKRITAGLLSVSMMFNSNMTVFAVGEEDGQEEVFEEQEPVVEEIPDTEELYEEVINDEGTPVVIEEEWTPEPEDATYEEVWVPEEEVYTPEDPVVWEENVTEETTTEEVVEEVSEPEMVSYTVVGVYRADEAEERKVLSLGSDAVGVETLAEEYEGFVWNGSAYVTKDDGGTDRIVAIANDRYIMGTEGGEVYSVYFSDVFSSDTVTVVFEYTKEEIEEEVEQFQSHFEYENNSVKVIANAYDNAGIPEGASLHADYLVPGTPKYVAAVTAILKDTDNDPNKTTEFVLYDIYFEHEGTRIEPNDNVDVTVSFKQAISPKKDNGTIGDVDVVHVDNDNNGEIVDVQGVSQNNEGDIEEITFTNDSFSTYGVKYTVDYTYDGYTYHMQGNTEMYLSELFSVLGINESTWDVLDVTFTNYELLGVEARDGDFLLVSYQPFTSEETLTVNMRNGDTYLIHVTDEATGNTSLDLSDYLVSASIRGAEKDDDGKTVVQANKKYSIRLEFRETEDLQFVDTNDWMTMTLPNNIEVDSSKSSLTIMVSEGTESYPVKLNEYEIEGNTLRFRWNTEDENFHHLTAASNATFYISIQASVDAGSTEIKFSDTVKEEIVTNDPHNVSVQKSGWYNSQDNLVHYQIFVNSVGSNSDVKVTDVISGAGLSMVEGSIVAQPSIDGSTAAYSENGFVYTIPKMTDGQTVTLSYTASINPDQMTGYGTPDQTRNTVDVTSDEDNEGGSSSKSFDNEIKYATMSKSGGSPSGPDNAKIIPWTITVNPETNISLAGKTITDTISTDSNGMTYTGNATIAVYDEDGNQVGDDRSLEIDGLSTWTYNVPDSDGKYKYVITYNTVVDVSNVENDITVKNTSESTGIPEPAGAEVKVGPGSENKLEMLKQATSTSLEEITWKITLKTPATGLDKAEFNDPFKSDYSDKYGNLFDSLKPGSLSVTAVDDLELYFEDNTDSSGIKLVFYKDAGHVTPGIKGNGASQREIIISFTTLLNDSLREGLEQYGSASKQNTATLTREENRTVQASDTVLFTSEEISKTYLASDSDPEFDYTDRENVRQYYRYQIVVKGGIFDNGLHVTDAFDTDILKYITSITYENGNVADVSAKIYGGNEWNAKLSAGKSLDVSTTSDGLVFDVSADQLPREAGGAFYSAYAIEYALEIKDDNAISILNQRAGASGGTYSIRNDATRNDLSDNASVDYTYSGISKTQYTNETTSDNPYITYRIDLNPAGVEINGGDPYIVTDNYSGMSVDYSSIAAVDDSGAVLDSSEVYWDFSGNNIYFTVLDGRHVIITYRGRLIVGSDGQVNVNNVATIESINQTDSSSFAAAEYNGGSASVAEISIMKYAAGNQRTRLSGAVFGLYDKDGQAIIDQEGNPVTFETGEDGIAHIKGNREEDGWSLSFDTEYILKELTAPDGYQVISYDPHFTIKDQADYDHYIYYGGDTLAIKDYPGTDLKVNKVWEDGNENHSDDTVVVRLQQKIGENGEFSDTIRYQKDNTWIEEQITLSLGVEEDWSGVFKGLPLAVPSDISNLNSDDVPAEYRVIEIKVNDELLDDPILAVADAVDARLLTVTNAGTSASVKVTKAFSGLNQLPAGFTITNDFNDDVFTVENADGSGTEEDPYSWGIDKVPYDTEVTFTEQGIRVDGYNLTVTKNGETVEVKDGKTTASVTSTKDIVATASFVNTYEEKEITTSLVGNKTLTGRNMSDGEFTFVIEAIGNNDIPKEETPLPEEKEVTSSGALSGVKAEDFTFGPITYTKAGTYSYRIRENEGALSGVAYDSSYYDVDVIVTRTDGKLSVSETYTHVVNETTTDSATKAEFNNAFDTQNLSISKKVQGNGEQTVEDFLFTVTLKDSLGNNLSGSYDVVKNGTTERKTLSNGTLQVSLKKDETIVIKDLPVGTTYTVEENDYSTYGYETSVKKNDESSEVSRSVVGELTKDDEESVEFTNTRNSAGSLVVTKTTTGNSGDRNQLFEFTVRLDDLTVNGSTTSDGKSYKGGGSDVDITFVNGQATFKLKHGQKAEIVNLPNGTKYTVAETSTEYAVTITDNDSTNSENSSTANEDGKGTINEYSAGQVDFVNTLDKYGAFSIEKKTEGNEADKKSWFAFTIRLTPAANATLDAGKYGDVTFVKDSSGQLVVDGRQYFGVDPSAIGSASVPENCIIISKDHPVYIYGIPAGTTYKVEEDDYSTTYDSVEYINMPADGMVVAAQANYRDAAKSAYSFEDSLQNQVIVTNTRNRTGKLGIYKMVESNVTDASRQFTVRITLKDDKGNLVNGTFGEGDDAYTFTNGVLDVVIGDPNLNDGMYHNGVSIQGIPTGYTYSIEELDANEYNPKIIETAQFDSVDRGPSDQSGKVDVEIDSGTSKVYYLLPARGRSSSGSDESEVQQSGLIGNKQHNFFITNTKWSYGALVVSKEVTGTSADTELKKDFAFKVVIDDLSKGLKLVRVSSQSDRNGEAVDFTNGEATIELRSGEQAIAIGLKTGSTYEVTETTSDPHYSVNASNAKGTINEISTTKDHTDLTIESVQGNTDVNTAEFENHYSVGNLTIQKTVTGNNVNEADIFTVKVTLTASSAFSETIKNGTETVKDANGNDVKFVDNVAEFAIKANSSITLYGLPADISYTVEETYSKGYTLTTSSEKLSGNVPKNDETKIVTLVNEKNDTGALTLSKAITGNVANKDDAFTFRIEITPTNGETFAGSNHVGAGSSTGVSANFVDGVAEVTLKGDQKIVITGIPNGSKYAITETDTKGYQSFAPSNNTGTINVNNTASLEVNWRNERVINGKLHISKSVTGNAGDKSKWFDFTVTLKDQDGAPISGTFSGITFGADGKANVRLQDGQTIDIDGLPVCSYEIEETNADDYDVKSKRSDKDEINVVSATGKVVSGQIDPYKNIGDDTDVINTKVEQYVQFTNNKDLYGGLSVTKKIQGNAAQTGGTFSFEVAVTTKDGKPFTGTVPATKNGSSIDATFKDDGTYQFTLSDNETFVITDKLPNGATYVVNELNSGSYTVTKDEYASGTIKPLGEGSAISDENKTTFINTLDVYGSLTLKKVIEGNAVSGEEDKTFSMRVSVYKNSALNELDTTVNGQMGDVTFTNGTAIVGVTSLSAKTITDLPNGDYVFISEEDYTTSGYDKVKFDQGTPTTIGGRDGVFFEISGENAINVTATNTRNKPKLIVKKTFEGDSISDDDKNNIKFVVTGPDNFREEFTYADMEDGEKSFENLNAGGKYTVTETNAAVENYNVVTTYAVGNDSTQSVQFSSTDHTEVKTINITNSYEYLLGKLKVIKTFNDGVPSEYEEKNFKVTIQNSDGKYLKADGSLSDTEVTHNISVSEPLEIDKVPVGSYSVKELDDGKEIPGYSIIADDSVVTATADVVKYKQASAKITNAYKQNLGNLKLTKSLSGAPESADSKSFQVTITNGDGKYLDADGTLSTDKKELTVSKSLPLEIQNIPVGTYTISEVESSAEIAGYTLKTDDSITVIENVVIEDNQTTEKELVNTYEQITTSYEVEKVWDDTTDSLRASSVTVKLLADGAAVDEVVLNADNDWKHTFEELPVYKEDGTTKIAYSAVEVKSAVLGLITSYIEDGDKFNDYYRASYTHTEGKTTITNTLITGDLQVSKSVGGNAADYDKEFKFTVKLDPAISGDFVGMVFDSGVATFTLKDGGVATATGIPAGVKYTVTEEAEDGYKSVKTGDTGTITTDKPSSAEFINYKWKVDVTPEVKKVVEGTGAPDEAFTFILTGDNLPEGYVTEKSVADGETASFGTLTFTSAGTYTCTIEEVVPENPTIGMTYSTQKINVKIVITADSSTGKLSSTVTYTGGDGDKKNTITNTYAVGDLSVSKSITGNAADTSKKFSFTVQLDKKLTGTFGDMEFTDGVATFELGNNETVKATGLPAGVKYTVTEEADGYTSSKTGDKGTIVADRVAEAKFINSKNENQPPKETPKGEYKSVNISARKAWDDNDNRDGGRPKSVKVHLLANGVDTGFTAELKADNNWFYEWYELPLYQPDGTFITYDVVEEEVPGYRAEVSGDMYGGYVITNTRKVNTPNTSDGFHSFRLSLTLMLSMVSAMLSAIMLRKKH